MAHPSVAILNLKPELAKVAAQELNEPIELADRLVFVDRLVDAAQAAGLVAPWFGHDRQGYALMFLRWAKFDHAKALERLVAMDSWLSDPDLGDVTKLRAADFRDLHDLGLLRVLNRTARCGSVVHLLTPANIGAMKDPEILLKFTAWVLQRSLYDPRLQVCGQVVLDNFRGLSFMQALRFQRDLKAVVRRHMKYTSDCAPFRLKAMVLIHQPSFFGLIYAIVSPFLSKKIKQRMIMMGNNMGRLYDEVMAAEDLPSSLGGTHSDDGEAWFEAQAQMEAELFGESVSVAGDGDLVAIATVAPRKPSFLSLSQPQVKSEASATGSKLLSFSLQPAMSRRVSMALQESWKAWTCYNLDTQATDSPPGSSETLHKLATKAQGEDHPTPIPESVSSADSSAVLPVAAELQSQGGGAVGKGEVIARPKLKSAFEG